MLTKSLWSLIHYSEHAKRSSSSDEPAPAKCAGVKKTVKRKISRVNKPLLDDDGDELKAAGSERSLTKYFKLTKSGSSPSGSEKVAPDDERKDQGHASNGNGLEAPDVAADCMPQKSKLGPEFRT